MRARPADIGEADADRRLLVLPPMFTARLMAERYGSEMPVPARQARLLCSLAVRQPALFCVLFVPIVSMRTI